MVATLDEAVLDLLQSTRTADDPGQAWREAAPSVRPALLRLAAEALTTELAHVGRQPTPGLLRATEKLVDAHAEAIGRYHELIDGAVYAGKDPVEFLADDRVEHLVEVETRHLRSGIVALVEATSR